MQTGTPHARTQAQTHRHARTPHAHTHARLHAGRLARLHARTHLHTHTHACTHAARTHPRTDALTHALTHTRTNVHTYTQCFCRPCNSSSARPATLAASCHATAAATAKSVTGDDNICANKGRHNVRRAQVPSPRRTPPGCGSIPLFMPMLPSQAPRLCGSQQCTHARTHAHTHRCTHARTYATTHART